MDKKRIFIVDDESGFTRLLKLTLEKTGGYLVKEENDGTNAWRAAREFKPDIIFLDIVMPKIDGGDVAQQIRSDPTPGPRAHYFPDGDCLAERDKQRDWRVSFPRQTGEPGRHHPVHPGASRSIGAHAGEIHLGDWDRFWRAEQSG